MPYCNWCQLDSDSPDVCVWCKRPYGNATPTARFGKADIHFLRHDDDGGVDSSFPFFAIAGVLIFVGIIAYAVVSFHGDKKQETALNWTLPQQTGNATWQPPAMPTSTTSPPRSQPATAQLPSYRPLSNSAPRRQPAPKEDSSLSATYVNPQVAGSALDGSMSKNHSVYFESISFSVVKDDNKVSRLVGDVVTVNDTNSEIRDGKLWVNIAGTTYPLVQFDGSVEAPRTLPPFSIESRASITCHVIAKGFGAASKLSGRRILGLDARSGDQSVHMQSDMVEQQIAVAQG